MYSRRRKVARRQSITPGQASRDLPPQEPDLIPEGKQEEEDEEKFWGGPFPRSPSPHLMQSPMGPQASYRARSPRYSSTSPGGHRTVPAGLYPMRQLPMTWQPGPGLNSLPTDLLPPGWQPQGRGPENTRVPGLSSQQGTPNVASGSGNIPSPSARPPSAPKSGRPSEPKYDSLSKSATAALGPLTDDDRQYLRRQQLKNHVKQLNKAAKNVANPIVPPGAGPPGVSTAVPPGAGGGGGASAGGGGGAPPAAGVGAAVEPPHTYMHGEEPNHADVEGGFKIPKNKEPIGGMGLAGVGGGATRPPPPTSTKPDEARQGEGEYVPPPYGDGSAFAEKAREPDSDRVDPITPASGSKQTPETANSLVSADKILESAKKQPQEDVLGTAEERANMGKGAFSGYEFAGPYDYPSYPSGRRDTQLTSLGAWRSKTGEHSASLWSGRMTAKGTPAKRDKYYKWSTKGGGNWSKLNSADAMRVMTKNSARKNGARWMDRPNPGQELTHLMSSTLKRKMEDIQMGKAGNERMNKRKKGQDATAGRAACGGGGHQVQM